MSHSKTIKKALMKFSAIRKGIGIIIEESPTLGLEEGAQAWYAKEERLATSS